ncbi:MAG: hypothetical protein FWG97_05380 [Deltaproteobacteria bacterium]|nr:hypothetical protein [Deltaproteobacteria bacterium]
MTSDYLANQEILVRLGKSNLIVAGLVLKGVPEKSPRLKRARRTLASLRERAQLGGLA